MGIRKKEGLISQTVIKYYSLGIVTEIWMGRSQKSGGDLEMVGGGSELKWKAKGLHKGQSCKSARSSLQRVLRMLFWVILEVKK